MFESDVKFADNLKDSVSSRREAFAEKKALTANLILGSTSPSGASSRSPSTAAGSSQASSRPTSTTSTPRIGTPPSVASHCIVEVERCGCCTIDDFWKIYDSFRLMDKRGCGSVRRCDFYEASTEHVTLEMRRAITRGDLHERFRSSPAELKLEELLHRIWPNATDDDRKKMVNWTKLRDASTVLSDSSFKATREDLKRIFDLLDADGSQTLSMGELVRARIITKRESQNLLAKWYKAFSKHYESPSSKGKGESLGLDFNEFCMISKDHLYEKFVSQKEETWKDSCRSAYKASRAATAKMIADREGRQLPSEEVSPQKTGLKRAGLAVVSVSMFTKHPNVVMAC